MSFNITSARGLQKTGLSIDCSGWTNGIFLGVWIYSPSGIWVRGLTIQDNADGGRPILKLECDTNLFPRITAGQAGGTNDFKARISGFSANTWTFVGGHWAQDGTLTLMQGTTVESPYSTSVTNLTSTAFDRIGVGVYQWDGDGTSDVLCGGSLKLAMPFIAKRMPTTGAGSELVDLVTNLIHPADIFGADLYDYWPLNSKTSAVNGWVLAEQPGGGTITIDTGENPAVNDPSSGQSAVPLLMSHYEG